MDNLLPLISFHLLFPAKISMLRELLQLFVVMASSLKIKRIANLQAQDAVTMIADGQL
jgi:hypothetical protein